MGVSISEDEESDAKFAAETQVFDSDFMMSNTFDPEVMLRYNRRVVSKYGFSQASWNGANNKWPGTGGTLERVIGVEKTPEGSQVTICSFDSPGLFDVVEGKPTHDPGSPHTISAQILTVARTTAPSAAGGNQPEENPRPLVVSVANAVPNNESPGVLCNKFAPDPFIQSPPAPLPVSAGHK
ncbi:hypothetical protein [Nocardia spumae]|uniref:hypothetical protein n=1 Tax=Nocardia spumae TaxID=2887190 RepID=UPI001D152006|nr:hypothetical protein [Nocardia spumae]